MQLQPTFSIITITYNAVRLVEQTLLNVLSQSYPNIEYIVIDGGSTDGTVDIIRRYESGLAYWVSEPDKGIYERRRAIMSGSSTPAIPSVRPIRSSRSFPSCRRGRLCRISSMGRRISWTRKGGHWDYAASGRRGSSRGRVSGWGCWFATSRSYQNVRLPRHMICNIAIRPISTGVSVA